MKTVQNSFFCANYNKYFEIWIDKQKHTRKYVIVIKTI